MIMVLYRQEICVPMILDAIEISAGGHATMRMTSNRGATQESLIREHMLNALRWLNVRRVGNAWDIAIKNETVCSVQKSNRIEMNRLNIIFIFVLFFSWQTMTSPDIDCIEISMDKIIK